MTEFGEQTGEVRIATLHDSVTLEDGTTIEVGDVVGWDVRGLNEYADPENEPLITSELCTGTVETIYNHDGEAEVSITNDNYGRIAAEDLQVPAERWDRFRSEVPEGEGCIIERWYAAFTEEMKDDFDEYEIEVNAE